MTAPFAVLNPGGRDANQSFPDGAGAPGAPGHPPVNYHGYAACVRGGFYRDLDAIPGDVRGVLVLLRKRNLRKALRAVGELKRAGRRVWISFKESGTHQVAGLLGDVSRCEGFRAICRAADGCLSSTPDLEALYRASGCADGCFLPTPYPIDAPAWDVSVPPGRRNGIFVGTREFDVPSRRHFEAVALADQLSRKLECPLAVINSEGRRGGMILKSIRKGNPFFYIIEGPLDYAMYLKLMASHRIVFQLDQSRVPGQVAGDALLCRIPCVGGNGAIDRLAFGTDGMNDPGEALRSAERLLTDDAAHLDAVRNSQARALAALSFGAAAARIESLLAGPAV